MTNFKIALFSIVLANISYFLVPPTLWPFSADVTGKVVKNTRVIITGARYIFRDLMSVVNEYTTIVLELEKNLQENMHLLELRILQLWPGRTVN